MTILQITPSGGGYNAPVYLVDQNDYQYQQLLKIVNEAGFPREGTVLTFKDNKYQWLPVTACFAMYAKSSENGI